MIVRASQQLQWLAERSGCVPTESMRAIEAVDASGRLLGVVGCDGWTENSVQMHIAIESPIALRKLVPAAFDYAFRQANRGVAICIVRSDNSKSLNLVKRLGFEVVGQIPDGFSPGVGIVIHQMRREHCRFLGSS